MKKVYIRHKISIGEIHNVSDKESSILRSSGDVDIETPIRAIAPNGVFLSQVVHIGNGSIEIEILELLSEGEDVNSIAVMQSLIKEDRFKYCIEKSVEIGADEIIPIHSGLADRTFESGSKSYNNWMKYIEEAGKQSLRQDTITLDHLQKMKDLDLAEYKDHVKICFTTENIETKPLNEFLINNKYSNKNFLLAVGPEKGWSNGDIDFFERNGFEFITLGDSILRSETVAPIVIGIIKFYSNTL